MNDVSKLTVLKGDESVVELTMSLLISVSSLAPAADAISGKVLGLVNLGGEAGEIARRATAAFGMTVQRVETNTKTGTRTERLDELLGTSDFIVIGGEALSDGSPVISANEINRVKPDARLLLIGNPETVDQLALISALWFETIGGAGMALKSLPVILRDQFAKCPNAVVWPGLPVSDVTPWYGENLQQDGVRPRLVA